MPTIKNVFCSICLLTIAVLGFAVPRARAQRPFTVADDIGMSYFGDPFLDEAEPIVFSPNRRYVVVHTERGRLDIDRPESTLRVYRLEDIRKFLLRPARSAPPAPLWEFSKATYKDGPVIQELRWLSNSQGFGFLAASESGNKQLFLANLKTKRVRALTSANQQVESFDIRDSENFVYTAQSPAVRADIAADSRAVRIVGTNRAIAMLLSPDEMLSQSDLSELWAVVRGKRFVIEDQTAHEALPLHWRGQQALALSPDGSSVITALPVPEIPAVWETLYPSPPATDNFRIQAGPQNVRALAGWFFASRYVLIDLRSEEVKSLPLGPLGYEAGWWAFPIAAWSPDGKSVVLTNTFLDREVKDAAAVPARPCQVVLDLARGGVTCLEQMKGSTQGGILEDGYHTVDRVRFDGSSDRITLEYTLPGDSLRGASTYVRSAGGSWAPDNSPSQAAVHEAIRMSVQQGLNDPPVLAATDSVTGLSRVIWDPNPQFRGVDTGGASVYKWTDESGRELVGGLFKPFHYEAGRRYPLVIQTHGFSETEFIPSGIYPTSFAARALAGAGFMVLQVRGCRIRRTTEEGPCQVSAYESAVKKLSADGLIDPTRVGIVGFSRTCYYVLEALTRSTLHFKAASIASGVDMGYMQYMLADLSFAGDGDSGMGAPPFGEGLQQWLKRSPGFNMDKVTTPLMVVAVGRADIPFEWQPYSTLLHLHKPVDLIVLKEGTHPLSNPGQRMASQGGTVDWMRFWLMGEEDPDPAKADQYVRWRKLRTVQDQGGINHTTN
jgi:dipeptidyl aminopeptidase/acylaminoacyl peptidase